MLLCSWLGVSRAWLVTDWQLFLNAIQLGSKCRWSFYSLCLTSLRRSSDKSKARLLKLFVLITITMMWAEWWVSSSLSLSLYLFSPPALQRCSLQGQGSGGPHCRYRWVSGWGDCSSTWRMGSQNPDWAAQKSPLSWQKVGVLPSISVTLVMLCAFFVRAPSALD